MVPGWIRVTEMRDSGNQSLTPGLRSPLVALGWPRSGLPVWRGKKEGEPSKQDPATCQKIAKSEVPP